jgi:hypothetical protein
MTINEATAKESMNLSKIVRSYMYHRTTVILPIISFGYRYSFLILITFIASSLILVFICFHNTLSSSHHRPHVSIRPSQRGEN